MRDDARAIVKVITSADRHGARVRLWTVFWMLLLTVAVTLPLAAQQPAAEDDQAYSMGNQGRMVRGSVTATAADHLTVKTDTGDSFQVVVTSNTRIMKERQPVKLSDVRAGDGIGVMGVVDAATKTVHAAMLFVVDAAQMKKLREDMGKTYISGTVTAVDELEITVHRQDGVTQKITVDEGTSFRKGGRRASMAMRGDGSGEGTGQPSAQAGSQGGSQTGESITLADIKVGDMIAGPGNLRGGVFVPTQLMVMDASKRRRPEGGGQAPQAATPH